MENPAVEDDANDINSTLLELQEAFAAALRNAGVMGKLRAQLRAAAVGVIRGDPHLHEAAIGRVLVPATLSPEGRVALLLIEDFMCVHGLRHSAGVLEAESNMARIGDAERNVLRDIPFHKGAASLLEGILSSTLNLSLSPDRVAGTEAQPGSKPDPPHAMCKIPAAMSHKETHPEIAAAVADYEDSVDFSDESEHGEGINEQQYDYIERL